MSETVAPPLTQRERELHATREVIRRSKAVARLRRELAEAERQFFLAVDRMARVVKTVQ